MNPIDLQEAHHHLTKAILFLDRNGVEDQVEVLLKVKTALPRPSEKKRRTQVEGAAQLRAKNALKS